MTFLNAWALGIGALALAAPLAVHLLTRPKPVPFSLSTMKLLAEVIQQRRARSRIRDWLVLLLRALAVALLAMAIARPVLEGARTVPATAEQDAARVVLVDVSQSMAAGSGGVSGISQARTAALEFLDAMPGVQANVIFVGAQPRPVFEQLSPNLPSLRQAVQDIQARPEQADVSGAVQLAGRMLQQAEGRRREMLMISDFQRANWGALSLASIPEDTDIRFHSVSPVESDNVAVTAVRVNGQAIEGQAAVIEVELSNQSDTEVNTRCRIQCGPWQRSVPVVIAPRATRTIAEMMAFERPGWYHGEARIESNLDVLPEDDRRPLAVRVRPAPRVLLVTRQPSTDVPSSSWYLQQAIGVALSSGTGAEPPITVVHPGRLAPASWPEADLYVIDHPGLLDSTSVQWVASRVRRGRGLLYVASELADAMNVEQLGQTLGSGFEPPVRLLAGDDGAVRKDLFVSRLKTRELPFRVLGASAEAALRPVRFGGGLPTRTMAEGLRDQVLAELSDSSALLYVTGADAGRVGVLNADLGESNWPVQGTFLPVLGELVQHLLSGAQPSEAAACGETLVRMLPPEVSDDAELTAGPAEPNMPESVDYGRWEWSAGQGAVVWTWPEPTGPGVYELHERDQTVFAVATAAPALESDLQALEADVLQQRMAGGRSVAYSDAKSEESADDSLWNWLIVACVLGLIGEIAALRWFRV